MKSLLLSWQLWALLSAIFAALTAICSGLSSKAHHLLAHLRVLQPPSPEGDGEERQRRADAGAPSTWGGAWRGKLRRVGGRHDTRHQVPLCRLPLSRRGHQHAVWLYFRFPLSLRMVEEMLAARGIDVSHETVRQWARKFGQGFANQIRRRLPSPGDKWHLDEVCLMIRGKKHWLWRAVDQDGVVLDVLVQSRRDKQAAKRLLRKLLKRQSRVLRVMIMDKLASYGAAKGEVMPSVEHRRHKGLYGDVDVKVRVQRQRSSSFVGR